MKDTNLEKELRAVDATTSEIEDFTKLTDTLKAVHAPQLSAAARQRIEARLPIATHGRTKRRFAFHWPLASVVSFAVLLVAFGAVVELAAPNSPFYGVKQSAARMTAGKDQKEASHDAKPLGVPTKPAVSTPTLPAIATTYTPPQPATTTSNSSATSTQPSSSSSSGQTSTHKSKSLLSMLFFWQN